MPQNLFGTSGTALLILQTIFVVAPSFVLYGYNLSDLGGLVGLSTWAETFTEIDTVFTKGALKTHNITIQGVVVACFTLGAITGSFTCTFYCKVFGRKKLIFSGAFLTLIGTIIQASFFQSAKTHGRSDHTQQWSGATQCHCSGVAGEVLEARESR
jgi:MFS family permease